MKTRTSLLCIAAVLGAAALVPVPAGAQIYTLTKDQMIKLTQQNPFDRFPDGRPKVPDDILERARGLSAEEVWSGLNQAGGGGGRGGQGGGGAQPGGRGAGAQGGGYRNQYEGDFFVLHPKLKLVGRAVTAQFMPARPDLEAYVQSNAQANGYGRVYNQTVIDQLQAGDVLVVDLMGKVEGGTMVGDNLFYYIMKTTKTGGLVVDGGVRDLEGISDMMMPAYFRKAHPSAIANVTLTGINVPVRIGNATVLPGDMVVGDAEGVYFVPPQFAKQIVDAADTVHIHDEWTRKKFDEGKYKSSDIYGSPRDPALRNEYNEYLKKRLEEIRNKK